MSDPVARWHDFVARRDPALLDALLAADVVFQSPAVHTPQHGAAVARTYLVAAMEVLGNPAFRYVGEWRREGGAVLEFETVIPGDGGREIAVNGVDLIDWDAEGRITRFAVMVRPVKALSALIPLMAARLG